MLKVAQLVDDIGYVYYGVGTLQITITTFLVYGLKDVIKDNKEEIKNDGKTGGNVKLTGFKKFKFIIKALWHELSSNASFTIAMLGGTSASFILTTFTAYGT